jgi:hypothetical protein
VREKLERNSFFGAFSKHLNQSTSSPFGNITDLTGEITVLCLYGVNIPAAGQFKAYEWGHRHMHYDVAFETPDWA